MESNVFHVVALAFSSSHYTLSPVPPRPCPPLKINSTKGVYPMESNVFDVVFVTSSSSHCSPLKINPKGVYPP